jgi:hypothetical protein
MSFDSYHWRRATLGIPELERARALVSTSHDRASFELLLRSDDMPAVGITLDQYQYGESTSRWGTANPFVEYSREVAARARAVLREPLFPGSERIQVGANHASALNALSNLIEPEDVDLVVLALTHPRSADLRGAAITAAGRVFEKASAPNDQLMAALEQMVLDDALTVAERIDVLSSLAGTSSPRATAVLIRALQLPQAKLQAHAARHLLDRDQGAYRTDVETVAQTWPAEPPYPADEVLQALHTRNEQGDSPEVNEP